MNTNDTITQLGILLRQLARKHAFRIVGSADGGFAVELYNSADIATRVGFGANDSFCVAYQQAVNGLEGRAK